VKEFYIHTFIYFKPVKRFKNRSGVSEFWSFDDSTSKGVPDLLEMILVVVLVIVVVVVCSVRALSVLFLVGRGLNSNTCSCCCSCRSCCCSSCCCCCSCGASNCCRVFSTCTVCAVSGGPRT